MAAPQSHLPSDPPRSGWGRGADRAAAAFSVLLSPYVVTAALSVAISSRHAPPGWRGALHGVIAIVSSSLVPMLFTWWRVRGGHATDMHAAVRAQRHPIFLVAIISTALGTLALQALGAAPIVVGMGWAYCVSGVCFWAVTAFWKISMHSGVVAGAVVIAARGFGPHVVPLLLPLVPVVSWARVHRARHTVGQVLAGAALGTLTTWAVFVFQT